MTIALVLALVVPSGAAAQSLRFVGPSDPREVSLPLYEKERRGQKPPEQERRGSITVVIRNVSGVTGVLKLRFFPDRGRPVLLVGDEDAGSSLAHAKPSERVVFRRNQYRGIQVTFVLPKGQRLSRVNGMLVAQLHARGPGKSQKFPKAAQLRVRGMSPAVRFSPNEVSLKVRENCWLFDFGECGREAHVLIRGEDVAALPTEGPAVGHVVLGNGDGSEASLELSDVEINGDALTGTVKVNDHSGVGELEGSLPLAPGVAGGPELPVSVTVGHSLGLAILVVFLGAILGGLLSQLRGIRRQRALLGLQVESTLARYDEAKKSKLPGVPAGYDIEALEIQPRYRGRGGPGPFPADQGVSGLLWRINSAQVDQDFDEAATRTARFIDAVDWWIRLEPWARELRLQIDTRTVPVRKDKKRFTDCRAFHDTYDVREELSNPPKTEEAVQDRQQRAARQCKRLTRWRKLWHLLLELDKVIEQLTEEQRKVVEGVDVKAIEKATEPNRGAKNEEAEKRRVAVLEERLLDEAEDTLRYVLRSVDQELDSQVRQELVDDSRRVNALASAVGAESVSRPLAESELRWPRPSRDKDANETLNRLWAAFLRVQRGDYFWTVLSGLVASTAYTLTIWDETWGTVIDYATAFTAGFLTETVVNWAVLPAFQSYRARRRAAAQEAKKSSLLQEFEAILKRALGTSGSDAPSGS